MIVQINTYSEAKTSPDEESDENPYPYSKLISVSYLFQRSKGHWQPDASPRAENNGLGVFCGKKPCVWYPKNKEQICVRMPNVKNT